MIRPTYVRNSIDNWLKSCLLSLILVLMLQTAITQRAEAQDSVTEDQVDVVDEYFKRLESFGLSGSLLIGTKDKIFLKRDYGLRETESTSDPAYLVGSISKQYTATAILVLEQRGLLKCDDPISKYFDKPPADKATITIHQLLTHTSGLTNDYWEFYPDLSEEEYINMMLSKDLASTPGDRFQYVNIGYHLLALIIEKVTQMEYEEFLVEELFEPNGIRSTGFNHVDWKDNQVVYYNDWSTEGNEHMIRNPLDRPITLQPEGSGGLISTTDDLYKWYQLIFHSDKILTQASKNKLLTPEKASYAYGWENYKTSRGTTLIEHGAYDSWVGIVTGLYNFTDENLVVIFLGNTHMSQFLRKDDLMNSIEALLFGGQICFPPLTQEGVNIINENRVGEYAGRQGNGLLSLNASGNSIRLRTKDVGVIQKLIIPKNTSSVNRTDVQLEMVFNKMSTKDFESIRDQFNKNIPFEYVVKMYGDTWDQLTSSMGTYLDFEVLNSKPNIYEGRFEIEFLVALIFDRGKFYLRAFRDHNGQLHFQPYEIPEKLEIYLSPVDKNKYVYWNIKSGLTSIIEFKEGNLIINGDGENIYSR